MATHTKQLAVGSIIGGPGIVEVATVPAGRTWIVKEVTIRNGHGVASSIRALLMRPSGTILAYLLEELGVAAGATRSYVPRFLVLKDGDRFGIQVNPSSGAGGQSHYVISGAELVGVVA